MLLVTAARTGEGVVADGEEQVVMPSLVGQRGCAGCRCRTGALALPRLTGIPHSQFSRRLKQRLQTGRSSPHFTLRRRQVLQPVRCESVSQSTIVRPLGSFFPELSANSGELGQGLAYHSSSEARSDPTWNEWPTREGIGSAGRH